MVSELLANGYWKCGGSTSKILQVKNIAEITYIICRCFVNEYILFYSETVHSNLVITHLPLCVRLFGAKIALPWVRVFVSSGFTAGFASAHECYIEHEVAIQNCTIYV